MNAVKRAAVLGHPIAHSLSPVLHNAAYAALGLTDWEYDAIDVESSGLADLLNSTLLERDDYVGFSLTMPLKVEVLRWLAALGLARESAARPPVIVDPLCEISGAANTLVKRSLGTDAELSAFNTDVGGIVAAIREVIRHGPVESVGILGAGATAASALAAAVELSAGEIAIFARPSTDLGPIRGVAARLGIEVTGYPLGEAPVRLANFDAVIATLPAFAADDVATGLIAKVEREAGGEIGLLGACCTTRSDACEALEPGGNAAGHERSASKKTSRRLSDNELSGRLLGTLLDVVYDPRPTQLQATWSALGGSVVGGERMLLHQAAAQVELMTGQPAPLSAMNAALEQSLGER